MNGAPTNRWLDRLASITALRLAVWVIIASISHEGVLTDPNRVAEWMDDHQFYSWEQSDRMTLLQYHQLPAWNPYWCGGTVGAAAPEDPFFGPDFILRLIFGVTHGRRFAVLLLVVLGFEGMYRLCRRLDSSTLASGFAAVVFGTCDKLASFLHDGWVNFFGFELIPMVLYFLVDGTYATDKKRAFRARLFGGFFVAWIVLSAGTYPTPYCMLAVGYTTIALAIHAFFTRRNALSDAPDQKWWRRILDQPWLIPWITAITIGVVAFGFSAGKMLPMLSFMRQFPRVFTPAEAHPATEVFSTFWARYATVMIVAFIGVVTADAAAGIFFGGAALFFALNMGDYGDSSLFHIMRSLPILGQLRFPDRFVVMMLLFMSVAASRGITRMEDAFPAAVKRGWEVIHGWRKKNVPIPPYPKVAGWLFTGLAALIVFNKLVRPELELLLPSVKIRPGTMYVQEGPRDYFADFKQSRGNRRDVHMFTPANMGSIYCVAGNPLPESALLRGDLPQEEYPEDPSKATVKRLKWTPNAIDLEVDAKEATTILINQNWAPEWRTSVGTVRNKEKLLAIDVPAGKNEITVAYKDRFLDFCLLVSFATTIAVAWYLGKTAYRAAKKAYDGFNDLPAWPDE